MTIRVPTERAERFRDLVHCGEVVQREALKWCHYILKFLARRSLRAIHVTRCWNPEDQVVFGEYLALLEYKLDRRDKL